MNQAIDINLTEAMFRAEEMFSGLTVEHIKLHDLAAAMAIIVNTMAKEYGVDAMLLIAEVENFATQIEEYEK